MTRRLLIAEAARLFAERGVQGVSVRDVTQAAGANVASVSYHFGGQQGLVDTVFEVHLVPVLLERELALGKVPAKAGVRALMNHWVDPLLGQAEFSSLGMAGFLALNRAALDFARVRETPFERMRRELAQRGDRYLALHLPGIAEGTRHWRWFWALELLERSLAGGKELEAWMGRVSAKAPLEDRLGKLLDFLVAAVEAPVSAVSRSRPAAGASGSSASADKGAQVEFGF